MIPFKLLPFTGSPSYSIGGEIHTKGEKLFIKYEVEGDLDKILFPPINPECNRQDELWKKTCFELFLGTPDSTRYYEYNFSPSGDWNCYQFFDYRKNPQNEELPFEPAISQIKKVNSFTLSVMVPLPEYFRFNKIAGISVITQEKEKANHFWALKHPREIPDFHDRRAFTLLLP